MFLNSSEAIATQVSALIAGHSSTTPISIAVAFWGQGAEILLSSVKAHFRVICNLRTGGTNPHVIRRLKGMEYVDVMQLDTLHAKVMTADGGAVVSSANFSTNGLGLEGPGTSAWLEAGVFIFPLSPMFQGITDWFSQLWGQSQPIAESDLIEAEAAWAKRVVPKQLERETAAEEETEEQNESDAGAAQRPVGTDNRLEVQTVHFEGRIKPHQRDLRSAAAIIALNGQDGRPMPYSPFVFLFSGGKTRRAFENHQDKFEIQDQSLRLKHAFVGYFVGTDGTMESCTDSKRRKSASPDLLADTAAWMLGRGPRPAMLEGTVESASLFSDSSQ